jgi:hypothetical protein
MIKLFIFLIRLILAICLLVLNCAVQVVLFIILWWFPVMIRLTRTNSPVNSTT